MRLRTPALALFLAAALAVMAGCGSSDPGPEGRPSVVVTHAILGSVVSDLVGGVADVSVLMPDGADPHDFQPSAKDIERLRDADLVVANGLGLEESLEDALREAESDGTPLFYAGNFVDVMDIDGVPDPHFWTDPSQMRAMVADLATVAETVLGADLSSAAAAADKQLATLDTEMRGELARVPPQRRKLVTGHESMGYFARRYGFTLVGAVVPGLSSQARVSPSQLADLKAVIEREDVGVVFAELGTPRQVVDTIADETGARVVEIPAHNLPDDGSYESLMRDTARAVARAIQ